MKTAVMMWIGSYYSPWFPYTIASTYAIADFIVVVNAGYDLKDPSMKEYEIPLEQVSKDIDELDVEGKIMEVKDFSRLRHKFPLMTQKLANRLKIEKWYDVRGMAGTLAGDIAYDEGAEMAFRIDTDTVCYRDVLGIRGRTDTFQIYQYEFCGDIYHLCDPGPDSPYNDAPYYYPPHKDDWQVGAGSPVIHATRKQSPDYHCAHLRWANPVELSEEEKYQHFRNRRIISLWTNEYGTFTDELFKKADQAARDALEMRGKPSDVPPPEACEYDRKKLREYIEETIK